MQCNKIEEYLQVIDETIAKGPFQADWASLGQHKTPQWYRKGRFGLFIHWGVYSVPAYASEWYPRLMYLKGSPAYLHHKKVYGGVEKFPYKNFVPQFKAEKFNADEWLDIFQKSGAKYIMPVGEHHDGFKMYKSSLNRWNAAEMGPHRDVLQELHEACDKTQTFTARRTGKAPGTKRVTAAAKPCSRMKRGCGTGLPLRRN